jgi:hypothetical protein
MKTFAQINEHGIVLNTIVAEEWSVEGFVEYTDSNPAHIGGDYFDGYFYPPQPTEFHTRNKGRWLAPKPTPDAVLDEATCQWIVSSQGADSIGA